MSKPRSQLFNSICLQTTCRPFPPARFRSTINKSTFEGRLLRENSKFSKRSSKHRTPSKQGTNQKRRCSRCFLSVLKLLSVGGELGKELLNFCLTEDKVCSFVSCDLGNYSVPRFGGASDCQNFFRLPQNNNFPSVRYSDWISPTYSRRT